MKKRGGFIILAIVGVILFIVLYYVTHDDDAVNNFVNTTSENEEFTSRDAEELGDYLINEAILFYEKTPGNTNKTKTIDDEEYLELDSFISEAEKIFSDKEINDFLDYYEIKEEDEKYYIKEENNKLVYIYDHVKARPKSIGEERIEYKVDWEYCEAEESSELSECVDTSAIQYKNTMTVEAIGDRWKITDFSLPETQEEKEEN